MLDTVKIGVSLALSKREVEAIQWTRTNSSIDVNKNQTAPTIFKILEDKENSSLPFIRYTYKEDDPSSGWLKVEVSIPKFICGSNVYELEDGDIETFYKVLRKYISARLRIPLKRVPSISQCTVEKLHICKNFRVGKLKKFYLKALSSHTKAKYQLRQYHSLGSNNIESIEWKAKKRKIKMYDKEAEIAQQRSYPGKSRHQQKAIGLLRYEIELSDNEIRKISPTRRAADVLRMDIAAKILQKGLEDSGFNKGIKYTSLQQIIDKINQANLSSRTKNSLITFVTRWLVSGEDECVNSYTPSNFWKNKSQIKKLLGVNELLIADTVLPPLQVIEKQKKTASVPSKQ
ncbi:phage/plasmid replication protein [Cytobacillus sp. Hz8]|uniref:phage/plasmid replication domain-containing protein n=1 Tax=Cytobacillus sp. Hz8 TaxID=3347168 RepID=UPI0035DE48FC